MTPQTTTQTTTPPAPTTHPTDPGFKLPSAVQRQIAEANRLMQQAPADEPVLEPQDPALEPDAPVTQPGNEPPAPVETQPVPEKVLTAKDWENRYQAMKGRFDAGERRISALTDEVTSLRRIIADLEMRANNAPARDAAPSEVVLEDLTPEEIADYGPDFLKVVEKTANRAVAKVTSRYEQEIADLKKNVGAVSAKTALSDEEKMWETLSERVPNYMELNTDQGFINWLAQPDPLSGQIRQNLLNAAFDRRDAPRLAAFFEGYQAATTAPREGSQSDSSRATAPGKVPLETFAAPGRAKSAAVKTTPEDKPIFTGAQVTKFFTDIAAGKFRGREAEAKKIEQQIFEAQNDGRIR